MKHHAEKQLENKKRIDPDKKIRCGDCNRWVRVYRTNICGSCGKQICHICWSKHMHNESED